MKRSPSSSRDSRPRGRFASTFVVDLALGLFAGFVGFGVGFALDKNDPCPPPPPTAICPTEDSCAADFHDGAWHIEEVTP